MSTGARRDGDGSFGHFGDGARTGVVVGVTMLVLFEGVPVHLALASRHPLAAWAVTLVNAATVAWLVADLRALRTRRSRIEDGRLRLRVGTSWSADLPLDAIAAARTRDVARLASARGVVRAAPKPATPTVLLELTGPRRVTGPFGMRLVASAIALAPDEREDFVRALAAAGVPVGPD